MDFPEFRDLLLQTMSQGALRTQLVQECFRFFEYIWSEFLSPLEQLLKTTLDFRFREHNSALAHHDRSRRTRRQEPRPQVTMAWMTACRTPAASILSVRTRIATRRSGHRRRQAARMGPQA